MVGNVLKYFLCKKSLGIIWEYPEEESNRYRHIWPVIFIDSTDYLTLWF